MHRETTYIRQEQIKKAVLDIIAGKGLRNITTNNLAERIVLTEGAIIRHSPTVRDIIKGMIDDVANVLIGSMRIIVLIPEKPK